MILYYADQIAKEGLRIGAIKLDPSNPFVWASGNIMPIYNDNRRFIFEPSTRLLIQEALHEEAASIDSNLSSFIIAGTSTAGIPWAALLSERLQSNFIYVRDKPKDHGLRNQIEGIDSNKGLEGRKVILIEDLISTGGSSARAVEAIRRSEGDCRNCITIFNYGLEEAVNLFQGLNPPCQINSLLNYDLLIDVARSTGYINRDQERMLIEWRKDPFGWGEKQGFPKVDKK